MIVLEANAPTSISGILSNKSFTNLAGGDIQINQSSDNGTANRGVTGSFTNNGRIRVAPIYCFVDSFFFVHLPNTNLNPNTLPDGQPRFVGIGWHTNP